VARLDFGRQLGTWGELRVGIGYLDQRASPIVGAPDLPIVRLNSGGYFARFSVDTADQVAFPTRGFQGAVQFTGVPDAFGADQESNQLLAGGSLSYTWRKTTASLIGRVVTDFDAPVLGASNQLGGFLRLSGLTPGQIAGRKTLFGGLVLYRQLARPSLLGFEMPLYVGGSVETGGAWNKWSELEGESLIWAGSVFFGANTILGPLYLAYGGASDANHSAYLALGRAF
jgi:NTE family protein